MLRQAKNFYTKFLVFMQSRYRRWGTFVYTGCQEHIEEWLFQLDNNLDREERDQSLPVILVLVTRESCQQPWIHGGSSA